MSSTSPVANGPAATDPSVVDLRRLIHDYTPTSPAGNALPGTMLGLADLLEELAEEDDEGLEAEVIRSALEAFPGLIAAGPSPEDLANRVLGGHLIDGEAAETLYTLGTIQSMLRAFEPASLTAALWRTMLLGIYQLTAAFVFFADTRGIEQCRELLSTAEKLAGSLAGRP